MTADLELERVREAYPDAEEPSAERLAALRATLMREIGAPPARRRPWRPLIVVAVAAAVAVATIVIVAPHDPQAPTGAETRTILRGAAAGVAVPPGAVLHVAYTSTQTFSKGPASRSRVEYWQATAPPYGARSISAVPGRPTTETAVTDGRLQLYDPRRETIYTRESPPPYTVRPAGAGHYRLSPGGAATITITAVDLRALRDGQDTIVWTDREHPSVVPFSSLVQQPLDIRETARALLRSRHPHVRRGVRFAGRPAIEISGPGRIPGSRDAYYVAPRTYHPLGVVHHFTGETVSVRFTVYRRLAPTAANRRLVTLPGAHPHARIDTTAAGYAAAAKRLFGPLTTG
jgi:hypothetical protein